jgi:uncharacterized membrane protein YeaQ/YmgE (transglycosylase-associated protein family)
MIGALILGLVAGFIGKLLMPGKDPGGFFATILLGLAGAAVGFLIFTELLGIGDNEAFDLGGLVGAIIGVFLAEMIAGADGLGHLMAVAYRTLDTADMYVAILTISLIGYVLDRTFLLARRRLLAWSEEEAAA